MTVVQGYLRWAIENETWSLMKVPVKVREIYWGLALPSLDCTEGMKTNGTQFLIMRQTHWSKCYLKAAYAKYKTSNRVSAAGLSGELGSVLRTSE